MVLVRLGTLSTLSGFVGLALALTQHLGADDVQGVQLWQCQLRGSYSQGDLLHFQAPSHLPYKSQFIPC